MVSPITGSTHHWSATAGSEIIVAPGSRVTVDLCVDGQQIITQSVFNGCPMDPGPNDPELDPSKGDRTFIYGTEMLVKYNKNSINYDGHVHLVPWQTVLDIALFVRGDGTDSQRLALSDAILEMDPTGKLT